MGTTSQKLTYLNDTKTKIRDGINAIGGDLDSDDTFRSYVDELDNIYNEMPKVSDTGSAITLDGTRQGKITLDYNGDTQQDSTTGKNLFNKTDYTTITTGNNGNATNVKTTDKITITTGGSSLNSGIYVSNANLITYIKDYNSATTYYVSIDVKASPSLTLKLGVDTTQTFNLTTTKQRVSVETKIDTGGLVIYSTSNHSGDTMEVTNIMISTSSDTSYEPYTNGASPNPDYPQVIETVTGRQDIEVCGKNLAFDISYTNQTTRYQEAIRGSYHIVEGKKYAFSFDTQNTNKNLYRQTPTQLGINLSPYSITCDGTRKTFVGVATTTGYIEDESIILRADVTSEAGTGLCSNFMVEEIPSDSSSSTSYEAYTGYTQEINLGKNLFDKTNITLNYRLSPQGSAYQNNGYFYSSFIKVEPNTTYTKNSPTADAYHRVAFYSNNDVSTFISTIDDSNTFTTPSNAQYLRFCGLQTELDTTQLEKGSQASSYSAYFTPIELGEIGDYQDFIREGTGKNLIPTQASDWENGGFNLSDGTLTENTKRLRTKKYYSIDNDINYYISVQNTSYQFVNIMLYNASKTYLGNYYDSINTNINGSTSLQINIPSATLSNVKYLKVLFKKSDNSDISVSEIETAKPMIELGTTATDFEPYGFKDKWYIHKEIGKVVLNGSEDGWSYPSANRFNLDNYITYQKEAGTKYYYSNNYTAYNQTGSNGDFNTLVASVDYGFNLSSTGQSSYTIRFKDTRYTSANDFKTWLSTHNTSVYYVLATFTDTEITNSALLTQLEAVKAEKSKQGQTNIMITSDDLPAILNASALKEWDNE